VISFLLAVSVSFAGDKISIDDIYGTWVNADYNTKGQMAKVIAHPNGIYDYYLKTTDPEPNWIGEETITGSWYDEEGNLWIKCEMFFEEERSSYKLAVGSTPYSYELYKFSDSGKVWEKVSSSQDYPDEMSPIAGNYAIYYRQ
jgi:hypothetical protein